MNILFLTTGQFHSIQQHAIYPDLLRMFRDQGHKVYSVSAYEGREGKATEFVEENGAYSLRVKIGNLTQTNIIEKGISTLLIEYQYLAAIRKYLSDVKFDLVMYSTPPITLGKVIAYIKKWDGARTYLLLKDIFPQNAVDLGMMQTTGPKAALYAFFRAKERKLYALSDIIGCMSQANADYVIQHNPEVDPAKVEICPNCVEVLDKSVDAQTRTALRAKYGIHKDKTVFIYGGNLGKPQGIPFLMDCLRSQKENKDAFFLVVGNGTEFGKLQAFVEAEHQDNVKLMASLPKEDYDGMVGACDVGMIFLDHRFTIPNFPSRLLSCMQAKLPVLCCTDPNSDVGQVAVEGGFGWWCESNSTDAFGECVRQALNADRRAMGEAGFRYLNQHYSTKTGYEIIMKHFEN